MKNVKKVMLAKKMQNKKIEDAKNKLIEGLPKKRGSLLKQFGCLNEHLKRTEFEEKYFARQITQRAEFLGIKRTANRKYFDVHEKRQDEEGKIHNKLLYNMKDRQRNAFIEKMATKRAHNELFGAIPEGVQTTIVRPLQPPSSIIKNM